MYKKIKCHIFLILILCNVFNIKYIYSKYITRDGKLYQENKNNLRHLQASSKKFLHNIFQEKENNNLISNYLSTKFLYWNQDLTGQKIKIGIIDSGIDNEI